VKTHHQHMKSGPYCGARPNKTQTCLLVSLLWQHMLVEHLTGDQTHQTLLEAWVDLLDECVRVD
jgi:hypothetical protein